MDNIEDNLFRKFLLFVFLLIVSGVIMIKCDNTENYLNDDSDIFRMSEQHRLYDSTTKALREQNYKEAQILKDSLERW
jgi:hypothetical protein